MSGELALKQKKDSLKSAIELDLNTIDALAYSIFTNINTSKDIKQTANVIIRLFVELKKKVLK
jgi:hypothetical protein